MDRIRPPDRIGMIDSLTGLRAIACWAVVLYHFQTDLYALLPALRSLKPWIGQGYLGPDVFFVLSGYVLSHKYAFTFSSGISKAKLVRYGILRIARIYPVHLLTLLGMAVLVLGAQEAGLTIGSAGQTRFDGGSFVQNLLLVQAWFGGHLSWNYPAWSVSAEFFAYLWFPLVVLVLARLHRAGFAWWVALAAVTTLVVLQLVGVVGGANLDLGGVLVRVSVEFVAGCLAHRAVQLRAPSAQWWRLAPPLAVVCFVVVSAADPLHGVVSIVLTPLVIASLANVRGWSVRLLSMRVLVAVGNSSYSVYLVHALVLAGSSRVVARLVDATLPARISYVIVTLVLVGLVGSAVHRLIEQPGRLLVVRCLTGGRFAEPFGGPAPRTPPTDSSVSIRRNTESRGPLL